ncbi:mycoredoxin [Egicoccus sp. AB-alg2]|uniref:mycoredoxin n=1 Tax=Egicoccus sp. AB-alg2 TaxID=3242693 RepID=UPI00359DF5D0
MTDAVPPPEDPREPRLRFEDDTPPPADAAVTVYWRPGCGFCSSLFRGLERAGLPFERVDIWQDDEAAAFVRSVADGNETVPTVRVGDLALVNPSTRDVLRAVADRDPDALPEAARELLAQGPGRLGQVLGRLLGGT